MKSIQLSRVTDLTPEHWSLWLDIQQASDRYESPYFRPEFTQAVAASRSDVEVAVWLENGQPVGFLPFQRGKFNLGRPVGGKLSDYHGPLIRAETTLDPREFLKAARLASWDFDHLVDNATGFGPFIQIHDKSPQIDLSEGFEFYARRRREAGGDTIHRQGQKTRKLGRDVGSLHFEFNADDEEAFGLMQQWKSAQYVRTGLADVFAFPWTLELLSRLRGHTDEDFSAPLSVLRAGGKLAAVALSLRSRGVLHSWFTAYNPELASYSPGLSLFIRLAEEAQGLGIRKIDLGRGPERYKWSLATGSVPVCEGTVSGRSLVTLARSSWRRTRDWVSGSPLASGARFLRPIREWLAYQ